MVRAPDVDSKAQKFQPANVDLLGFFFLQGRPKPQQMMNCQTFPGNCVTEHSSKGGGGERGCKRKVVAGADGAGGSEC